MRLKIVAAVAALISLTTVLVDVGSAFYLERLADGGGTFAWFPQLETVGRTALAYSYASDAAVFGLSILGVAALGYWAGLRLDLATQYRPLLGYLAVGGGAGQLLAVPLWGLIIGESALPFGSTWLPTLAILLGGLVATGLRFALVGLAGAALAEFGVGTRAGRNHGAGTGATAGIDPE